MRTTFLRIYTTLAGATLEVAPLYALGPALRATGKGPDGFLTYASRFWAFTLLISKMTVPPSVYWQGSGHWM